MKAAIPRTQAEELVSQLAALCAVQAPIDAISSRRFLREIERSQAVDAAGAFVARGLLAVLEWDEHTIHASFASALALRRDAKTFDFYATALQLVGDYSNAANAATQGYYLARTDLLLLRKAISYTYLAGRFSKAKELCDMYDKLCPTEPHAERKSIEQAIELCERMGIPEDLAADSNHIAFELLRERRILFHETNSQGDLRDGLLMLQIVVEADQETVEHLDAELGERLFDRIPGYDPSCYWIGYASKKVSQ